MGNQKGSLKDRLRAWRLFLNYKKRKQKKMNLEKEKKYGKFKIFRLTIIGLILGFFESRNYSARNKNNKIESNNLKLKYIDNGFIKKNEILKIEYANKFVKKGKNKLLKTEYANNKFIKKEKNSNRLLNKIKNSKVKLNINKSKAINNRRLKYKDQDKFEQNKLLINKTIVYGSGAGLLKKSLKVKKGIDTQNKTDKNTNNSKLLKSGNIKKTSQPIPIYVPVLELKKLNKNIDKCYKKIINIDEKIGLEDNYNSLYDYEFMINEIKIKLNQILTSYNRLRELDGFEALKDYIDIKEIDIYELRTNDIQINKMLIRCNESLNKIEKRRMWIINKHYENVGEIEKKVEEKKVKEKVEKKEQKKNEQKKEKFFEIMLANKIIYDGIAKERKRINNFQKSIAKMSKPKRRHSIFYFTKNIVSSVLNFAFSLFPITRFKNKMLGGFVSGVMINNSLRSVRKVLNPSIEITYIIPNLQEEIVSMNDYLNKMNYLCNDSLNQINDIKLSILKEYEYDIYYQQVLDEYLNDIVKIESQLLVQKQEITKLSDELDKTLEKGYQKVLKNNIN